MLTRKTSNCQWEAASSQARQVKSHRSLPMSQAREGLRRESHLAPCQRNRRLLRCKKAKSPRTRSSTTQSWSSSEVSYSRILGTRLCRYIDLFTAFRLQHENAAAERGGGCSIIAASAVDLPGTGRRGESSGINEQRETFPID